MKKTTIPPASNKRNPIPDPQLNPNGLHRKYIVSKTDNSPVDERAEYFVLRLDDYGKDPEHVRACRVAILKYADEIQGHLPQLATDIRARYSERIANQWPERKPATVPITKPSISESGIVERTGKATEDIRTEPKPEV
jgi:hypothetical protein